MRRGEIYAAKKLGGPAQPVIVLSNDQYNAAGFDPMVVGITDVPPPPDTAYVVRMTDVDPVAGWVKVYQVGKLRRQWLAEEPLGMAAAVTLTRIQAELRDLFDLP